MSDQEKVKDPTAEYNQVKSQNISSYIRHTDSEPENPLP